ncbi:hypothetical protein ACROYT_G027571 [Oculina patagonica]
MPIILKKAGFNGIILETLCTFSRGLGKVFCNLLRTPQELTGDDYGTQARVYLGFQAVQIFGNTSITASLMQIVSYVPYYVDKALSDATVVGLPITLSNFSDGVMETAHKLNKKRSLLFSGGRAGPISKHSYQEQVLRQQFQNEVYEMTTREVNDNDLTPEENSTESDEEDNVEEMLEDLPGQGQHVPEASVPESSEAEISTLTEELLTFGRNNFNKASVPLLTKESAKLFKEKSLPMSKGKQSKRLIMTVLFNDVLGVKLDGNSLTFDLQSLPKFETKSLQKGDSSVAPVNPRWMEVRLTSDKKPPHRIAIKFMSKKESDLNKIKEVFEEIPPLQEAVENGLQRVYPPKVKGRNAEESYPIIRDPTLVRAGQLALLHLLELLPESHKAECVTEMYLCKCCDSTKNSS